MVLSLLMRILTWVCFHLWFFFYAWKKTPFINIFYSRLHILTSNCQSQFFAAQFVFQHCSFHCSLLIKVVEVRTARKLALDYSVHSSCDLLVFWFLIACLHLSKRIYGIIQEAIWRTRWFSASSELKSWFLVARMKASIFHYLSVFVFSC